jgi:aminopeptidase YwaD
MRRPLLSAFLLVLLYPACGAAQSRADKKLIKALKADISYLASDALEGRSAASEGERKAGDYIIRRYEALQIPAWGSDYRHPYTFNRGKEWGATLIHLANEYMTADSGVFPLPFSANASISGDVLTEVQEEGAIWTLPLYDNAEEAANPHFDWEKTAWQKAKEAKRSGAKGILFYDPYGAQDAPRLNPHSEYETLKIPVAFVNHQLWSRLTANEANALKINLDIKLKKTDYVGNNIAAVINNKAPLTVVLGAHYDHLGYGHDGGSLYAGKEKQVHNGADDNASGTAALLELGAWLKKRGNRHYNYLLVHFSGEELGLLGSKSFVKEPDIDSSKIAYMLNMDMIGRLVDSTKALSVGGLGTAPEWARVADIVKKGGFRISIDSSGAGPSDHTSFYNKGIPVLFFFTGVHSDYHKPSDDADKINYEGEAQVIHTIENVIKGLESSPRPRFTPTRQTSMGKVRLKVTLGIMPDYSYQGEGVRVDGVIDGKPAAKAGILAGDIITQLGTDPVKGMQTYMEALSHQSAGTTVEVTLLREEKEKRLKVRL